MLEAVRAHDGTRLALFANHAERPVAAALMLHGIASHSDWYAELAAALAAKGITVYRTDRRGVAASEGARGDVKRWPILVRDVVAIVDEVRKREPDLPLSAIGISLGAVIVLATSLLQPATFRSHVILAPAIAPTLRLSIRERVAILGRATLRPEEMRDLPFTLEDMTENETVRETLRIDPQRTSRVTGRFLFQSWRMERFVRSRLRRIESPTLALLGGRDPLVDARAASESLRVRKGNRVVVFPDAGHMLTASLPLDDVADPIAAWIVGSP